jgi:hypothetical protein
MVSKQHQQDGRSEEEFDSAQSIYERGTPSTSLPIASLTFRQGFEQAGVQGCYKWRLTKKAVHEGVVPTARFRKRPTDKSRRHAPKRNPNRQAAGAKGGRSHAAIKKSRLDTLHHKADVENGHSIIPGAGAFGDRLPTYFHSDFLYQAYSPNLGADTLSYTGHSWGWGCEKEEIVLSDIERLDQSADIMRQVNLGMSIIMDQPTGFWYFDLWGGTHDRLLGQVWRVADAARVHF